MQTKKRAPGRSISGRGEGESSGLAGGWQPGSLALAGLQRSRPAVPCSRSSLRRRGPNNGALKGGLDWRQVPTIGGNGCGAAQDRVLPQFHMNGLFKGGDVCWRGKRTDKGRETGKERKGKEIRLGEKRDRESHIVDCMKNLAVVIPTW